MLKSSLKSEEFHVSGDKPFVVCFFSIVSQTGSRIFPNGEAFDVYVSHIQDDELEMFTLFFTEGNYQIFFFLTIVMISNSMFFLFFFIDPPIKYFWVQYDLNTALFCFNISYISTEKDQFIISLSYGDAEV